MHEGGLPYLFPPTSVDEKALELNDVVFLNMPVKNECKINIKDPEKWPWDDNGTIYLDVFFSNVYL